MKEFRKAIYSEEAHPVYLDSRVPFAYTSKARECLLFPADKVDCAWYVTFDTKKNDEFSVKKLNVKDKSVSSKNSRSKRTEKKLENKCGKMLENKKWQVDRKHKY